jgi:tRNA(fMet)-specific endonuclease VapC
MKYVFDTNVVVVFLNGRSPVLRERIQAAKPGDFAMCSVVWAELYYGSAKSVHRERTVKNVKAFAGTFRNLDFDQEAAIHYGDIRADLEKSGNLIGPNDLMIAAIARSRNLVLLTNNTGEFQRVKDLKIEDWTV